MKKNYSDSGGLSWNLLRKLFLIMRLVLFILTTATFSLFATGTYSQSTKVSVDLKNVTVKEVLKAIENSSEFFFIYNNELINVDRKVDLTVKDQKIGDVLKTLFADSKVEIAVIDRKIVLAPSFMGIQQQKISGIVTDGLSGDPLVGVNIVVEGTTIGVISDTNGKFTIELPNSYAVLLFSYIGYLSEKVSVSGKSSLEVQLTPDIKKLEEIVVIGYGSVKKSDVTGAVSSITKEKFTMGLAMAPEQMMQGKIAGVNIVMNSGEPGAGSEVRVRGGTSINAGNDPLYVIDGIPVKFDDSEYGGAINTSGRQTRVANNPLNMLNPSDIESISVLKDASATAIYGSRGANGVILVTTKKGVAGQTSVEYDGYVGISTVRKKLDVLSAADYRTYMGDHPDASKTWKDGGASTNWQDQIFQTALTHSQTIGLNGGGKNTSYRASVNYTNQDGIIITSNLQKITGRINVNHKALNDRLNMNLFLTNSALKNNSALIPRTGGGGAAGGTLRDAVLQDPTYPVFDSDGKYTFHGDGLLNPVEETKLNQDVTQIYRYLGNFTVDFKFTDWLSINTNVGFTKENVDRLTYAPIGSKMGAKAHGSAGHLARNNLSKLIETTLVLNKTLGKHGINAIAGYSYQEFENTGMSLNSTGFVSDATSYWAIQSGTPTSWQLNTYKNSNKLISFYGRASYDFNKKYLLTATLRRDGSTRFGANRKWGLFPSAALAWRISEEQFVKNISFITNLKLRASYGVTGNQEIGNYISLPTLEAGSTYYFGGNPVGSVKPNRYYNPDIQWESTAQSNIGLDFGFLKNRFTGVLEVYQKDTRDLLLNYQVPSPAVVNSSTANVGKIRNRGIELELNAVILAERDLNLEVYGTLSHNINKVVSLSNTKFRNDTIYTGNIPAPGFSGVSSMVFIPGYSVQSFYGYKFLGYDATGQPKYFDKNTDGKISQDRDRYILGNFQPGVTYGFGTKITYKRLSLDMYLRGVQGIKVLNSTLEDASRTSNIADVMPFAVDAAHENIVKDAITSGQAKLIPLNFSDEFLQDASYLRLENATVSYNFNVSSIKWLSKLGLYLTGQNLFVITKYKGFDPEINGGIDTWKYPRPRTIILGVKVQF